MCCPEVPEKDAVMAGNGAEGSPYFLNTPDSAAIPLADIVAREAPDPERVRRAHQWMRDAKEGNRKKRKPIEVVKLENGKYGVIDGNSTLQALRELNEATAIVRINH